MKTVQGDLLEMAKNGDFDAIIHGCNCFHSMSGGIAKQIADQFPICPATDIIQTIKGDAHKLGTFSNCLVLSEDHSPFIVINAYTQYNGGADVNYLAIEKAMKNINKYFKGKKIGFPAIGAGIAGGDWSIISNIIDKELKDVNCTYVEYVPN